MRAHPETLTKKVVLLRYFRNYMNEHLVKVCNNYYITGCILIDASIDFLQILPKYNVFLLLKSTSKTLRYYTIGVNHFTLKSETELLNLVIADIVY